MSQSNKPRRQNKQLFAEDNLSLPEKRQGLKSPVINEQGLVDYAEEKTQTLNSRVKKITNTAPKFERPNKPLKAYNRSTDEHIVQATNNQQAYKYPHYFSQVNSLDNNAIPLELEDAAPKVNDEEQPKGMSKLIKISLIVLLALNLLTGAIIISLNAYLVSAETAKRNEHERLVNNHPLYYKNSIVQTALRYNLQPAYVSAIIKCESSFKADAVSSVGALGLMQLMPDTADWISTKLNDSLYAFDRMAEPETNMEYGCWYLNFLSNMFGGDPLLTTAAYHTGQGQVRNWLADKSISSDGYKINIENMPDGPTKQYVRRVIDAYAVYNALYFSEEATTPSFN